MVCISSALFASLAASVLRYVRCSYGVPARKAFALLLEHLRCERDDLHEVLLAQLARDGPEDAGATRVVLVVDDHCRVLVERDQRSVVPAVGLLRADDDRLHDLALLDLPLRGRRLHGTDDHVAYTGVAPVMAADDPD